MTSQNSKVDTDAAEAPVQGVGCGALVSLWMDKETTPRRKGWYLTRREDGDLSWRAWGCNAWWKQLTGGWVEWFDGNGNAMRFDWMPRSRKSIDLNSDQLPDVGDYLLTELQRPANDPAQQRPAQKSP